MASNSIFIPNVIITISMNHVSWTFYLIKWKYIFVVVQINFVCIIMWPKCTICWEIFQARDHSHNIWIFYSNSCDFICLFLSNSTWLLVVGGHSITCNNLCKHTSRIFATVFAKSWRLHHSSSITTSEHFIQRMIIASCCGAPHTKSLNSFRILNSNSKSNNTSSRSN